MLYVFLCVFVTMATLIVFGFCAFFLGEGMRSTDYPRRARSALGVDTVLTLDVCLFVC